MYMPCLSYGSGVRVSDMCVVQ